MKSESLNLRKGTSEHMADDNRGQTGYWVVLLQTGTALALFIRDPGSKVPTLSEISDA